MKQTKTHVNASEKLKWIEEPLDKETTANVYDEKPAKSGARRSSAQIAWAFDAKDPSPRKPLFRIYDPELLKSAIYDTLCEECRCAPKVSDNATFSSYDWTAGGGPQTDKYHLVVSDSNITLETVRELREFEQLTYKSPFHWFLKDTQSDKLKFSSFAAIDNSDGVYRLYLSTPKEKDDVLAPLLDKINKAYGAKVLEKAQEEVKSVEKEDGYEYC